MTHEWIVKALGLLGVQSLPLRGRYGMHTSNVDIELTTAAWLPA
jgi:hypothetical protein